MLTPVYTRQFERDMKRAGRRGKDLEKFKSVNLFSEFFLSIPSEGVIEQSKSSLRKEEVFLR